MSAQGQKTRTSRVRVYIGDTVLTEPRAEAAIAELMDAEAGELDLEVIRVPDDPIERVESALRQVGMFSPGRCVLLKGALDDAEQAEKLFSFLSRGLDAASTLVVSTVKLDGRSRLYRWLIENAVVEDLRFERKSEAAALSMDEAGDFVRRRVTASGLAAPDARVVAAIVERAGASLGELGNEIDRICLGMVPGSKLTVEYVESSMRDMAGVWVFGFTDALFERKAGEALQVVDRLLGQGEAPLRIVSTVANRVVEILAAAQYARAEGLPRVPSQSSAFVRTVYPSLSASARRRFNRPYSAYHAFRLGQQIGVGAARALHRRLLDLDVALKSGGGEARHLFAVFVTASCARRV